MVEANVTRLRQQAEHCRRLALGVNDEPTIITLVEMAREFDEKADQLQARDSPGR